MMLDVEKLIEATGEAHDPDVVSYGLSILEDVLITTLVIAIGGVLSHSFWESVIFLCISMAGTSTLGGVSL